ncbi:MAG: putative Ig domain-containing protein, partial [Candidatus Aenigmatarchaeota archaeon]
AISGFKRGDLVSVKITPFDGKDYGKPKVLKTEIKNTAPRIIEHKKAKIEGLLYTYQVNATDADGDKLTYSLKYAPDGMSIDPSTGFIKWNVPPEFKGKVPVTVSVTDGYGGEAVQSLTLEIQL